MHVCASSKHCFLQPFIKPNNCISWIYGGVISSDFCIYKNGQIEYVMSCVCTRGSMAAIKHLGLKTDPSSLSQTSLSEAASRGRLRGAFAPTACYWRRVMLMAEEESDVFCRGCCHVAPAFAHSLTVMFSGCRFALLRFSSMIFFFSLSWQSFGVAAHHARLLLLVTL